MPFLKNLFNAARRTRVHILASVGSCVGLLSSPALAALPLCSETMPSQATAQTAAIPSPLAVPLSLAVGGVIAQVESSPGYSTRAFCVGRSVVQTARLNRFTTAVTVPGVTNVYQTNVPGVGIRIEALSDRSGGFPLPYGGALVDYPSGWQGYNQRFTVKLYKTAATVGSGTIGAGQLAELVLGNTSVYRVGIGAITVQPEVRTCTLNTASVAINLGNVRAGSLPSVGSVSPTVGPQNINVNCTGSPRLTMTLQGTQATGGPNTTVALTAGTGVAQGVGVQVLNGTNVLTIGTSVVVSNAAGNQTIPISARYYRTGNITAGPANAAPTLRFDYN